MTEEIIKAVDDSLADGWSMSKKISSGGLFTSATYDNRIVYNREELAELTRQGFYIKDNLGLLALRILLSHD